MQCPNCEHINKDGTKLCAQCNEKLAAPKASVVAENQCSRCGVTALPNAKFCLGCGGTISHIDEAQTVIEPDIEPDADGDSGMRTKLVIGLFAILIAGAAVYLLNHNSPESPETASPSTSTPVPVATPAVVEPPKTQAPTVAPEPVSSPPPPAVPIPVQEPAKAESAKPETPKPEPVAAVPAKQKPAPARPKNEVAPNKSAKTLDDLLK
jgi:hypothetical protein